MDNTIEARQLVRRLAKISPDAAVAANAKKMLYRLAVPMEKVIDAIPAETVVGKARHIGVTRQTIYDWLKGTSRPKKAMAHKLHRITGYDADEIRGRASV